ncbi:class I SAM-dependent methyltransferase [Oceanomicrobium pacificus]|uniref:Class I SAM-dependent methyltransferase n=1 Tax=Oceanomicrobium pacificus TaxID=2692916 RepID=A0A6B0TR64_9RHOB|nr:class I SAM-dependent methyltransferase [Oceanomicrobium pacificus]MXU66436.1 class I SAM-dependent methyltransferase [Oceanomicrobium pacificus]
MIDTNALDAGADLRSQFRGARGEDIVALYEHPRLPVVTYPYEWVFSQLKDAALQHLSLQLVAFDKGYVLSDATAYNMQMFDGRFLHIDPPSLRPYEDGKPWAGYNQFCRQFLLPLLLEAWSGLGFQSLYRGSMDGIRFEDALAVLPKSKMMLSPTALFHVWMHGRSVLKRSDSSSSSANRAEQAQVPKAHYRAILQQLRDFIAGLKSDRRPDSYWSDYAERNSYSDAMKRDKSAFVSEWAARTKPGIIWDLGGNTGDFSRAALDGGAGLSVLIDGDNDSIEAAWRNRARDGGRIIPVLMNLLDPSPSMGWRQMERQGLAERAPADGILALAVLHHMVIGGNLPMSEAVDWLMSLAPTGIIEFVPTTDPMVRGLMAHRDELASDYSPETFMRAVEANGQVGTTKTFEENGRLLVEYSTT